MLGWFSFHLKIFAFFVILQLVFCLHSINALFLLGDTSLNCMVSSGLYTYLFYLNRIIELIFTLSFGYFRIQKFSINIFYFQ